MCLCAVEQVAIFVKNNMFGSCAMYIYTTITLCSIHTANTHTTNYSLLLCEREAESGSPIAEATAGALYAPAGISFICEWISALLALMSVITLTQVFVFNQAYVVCWASAVLLAFLIFFHHHPAEIMFITGSIWFAEEFFLLHWHAFQNINIWTFVIVGDYKF